MSLLILQCCIVLFYYFFVLPVKCINIFPFILFNTGFPFPISFYARPTIHKLLKYYTAVANRPILGGIQLMKHITYQTYELWYRYFIISQPNTFLRSAGKRSWNEIYLFDKLGTYLIRYSIFAQKIIRTQNEILLTYLYIL